MSDMMWITASSNVQDESDARKLSMARVATSKFWPIIAGATSEQGLEDACAIISEGVTAAITPIAESPAEVAVLANRVMDSFIDDWDLHVASKIAAAGENCPKCKSTLSHGSGMAYCTKRGCGYKAKESEHVKDVDWSKKSAKESPKYINGDDGKPKCAVCHTSLTGNTEDGWKDSKGSGGNKGGHMHMPQYDLSSKATITDAPTRSKEMQAQWGLPVDQQTDTAAQLQAEVDAWESRDRNSRVNEGNGIGMADESSGPNVEGPGQNQGEDPVLHGDGNSHMDGKSAAKYPESTCKHCGQRVKQGQFTPKSQWDSVHQDGGWDPSCKKSPTGQHEAKSSKESSYYVLDNFGAMIAATASTKGAFLITADDEDEADENEDMQSEGNLQTGSSLISQAIKAARDMVDAMPAEASVEAVKKAMLQRAAKAELDKVETELVVSAAVTRAHEMGRRPLDKQSSDFKNSRTYLEPDYNGKYKARCKEHATWMTAFKDSDGAWADIDKHNSSQHVTHKETSLDKVAWEHKQFVCRICKKTLSTEEALVHHMEEKHHETVTSQASLDKESIATYQHNRVRLQLKDSSNPYSKAKVTCADCGKISEHKDEDEAKAAFKKHYEVHDNHHTAAGNNMDEFQPGTDGGMSESEGGGGTGISDDKTGSDPGGMGSSNSQMAGEEDPTDAVGESTAARTSKPRTKPSHNPNAVKPPAPPMPVIPMQQMNPMTGPQMTAAKLVEITEGILETNPGMQRSAAISIANKTLEQYPGILQKQAWGGADWLHGDEEGNYTNCPQCQQEGLDSRINRCHFCGFVNVAGPKPSGADSSWDSIGGNSTIKPGRSNLKNPAI